MSATTLLVLILSLSFRSLEVVIDISELRLARQYLSLLLVLRLPEKLSDFIDELVWDEVSGSTLR